MSSHLVQPGPIHLHLTQSQDFLFFGDHYVNVAAVHPVDWITLDVKRSTFYDIVDRITPGKEAEISQTKPLSQHIIQLVMFVRLCDHFQSNCSSAVTS